MMNVQRFGILVLATALVSCGGAGEATGTASYTVTVSPSSLSIALGVTQTTNAIVTRQLGASALVDPNAAVSWTSSDPTIATVTASGGTATITGVGHGTATITASSNSSSGSTTVTVTAPTCSPLTASNPSVTPGAISGTLGPADCRDDRASAAGRPADFYRVNVASDQLLTIDVTASGFTPDIRLISPTATLVDIATGTAGRIQRAVPAGTYAIAVGTNSGSGGTYSITLATAAITNCLLANNTAASIPATISGTLAVTDCRLSGSALPAAKLYKFTLTSAQTLTAVVTSTVFPPRLFINDASGRFVVEGNTSTANQSRAATLLAAGDYYAIVSGTNANPLGAFTLSLSTSAVQAGALTQIFISPSDTVTLEVTRTSLFIASGYDANFNTVSITPVWSVTAGGGTISSSGLFTAGTTSGTFANTVKASSGSISSSNTTTVVVIPTVAPCTSASAVSTITPTATATTLTGSLTTTDCKLSDGSFYVKVYKLTVAATATVQIDLSSTRFDTFLYLLDSGLAKIDANDDAFQPQNTDSRISRSLAPGTYFIGVNSYRNGATGAYTLAVKTVP